MRLLLLLGVMVLNPYWHVPRAAEHLMLVDTEDGTDLKCQVCDEVVYRWISQPSVTDVLAAAKHHKKHRKQ